jgi:rhodanese-related sulfurtransferase
VPEVVALLTALGLKERLDQAEKLAVLDVREEDERDYAAISLPSEVLDLHVPLGEVTSRFEEIQESASGRPLIVYCHHGQRSMVAASWLSRRGLLDVHNLEGGIDAWSTRVDRKVRRY